ATVNFAVIPAIIYDDFQSYANTAALVNASTGLGKHGAGPGVNSVGAFTIQTGGAVVIDPTGGPDGLRTMRYDWAAQNASECGLDYYVDSTINFPSGGVNLPNGELWIRLIDKLSPGFVNGND